MDEIIGERVRSGEEISLTYGKLMERLLTIKMIRENIPARGRGRGLRDENPTKAAFIKDLIPLAQKQLREIR